jgi:hypothetical protein
MRFISLAIFNPWAGIFSPEADVYIAVIVLTDIKPYKYKMHWVYQIILEFVTVGNLLPGFHVDSVIRYVC